jgi:Zn-dependent alcohol dehydrogenase
MQELNKNELKTVNDTAIVVSIEKDNENVSREGIIIINTSTSGQVITLGIDSEAISEAGIVLYQGGSWQDSAEGGYKPTQKMITAISNAVGGQLSIQERLIKRGL